MHDSNRHPLRFDVGVRLAGGGVGVLGWLALRRLFHLVAGAHASSAGEIALAMAGFLCVSAAATLVVLGRHIADRVAVSSRWHRTRYPDWSPHA